MTYALNLNSQLASIIWNICNTENKMISVERILQYSRIPSEAPLVVDYRRPPNNWPLDGNINIRCLEVSAMVLWAVNLDKKVYNANIILFSRNKINFIIRMSSPENNISLKKNNKCLNENYYSGKIFKRKTYLRKVLYFLIIFYWRGEQERIQKSLK